MSKGKNKKAMTSIDLIITLIIAFVTLFIVLGFITGMFPKLINMFPSVAQPPSAQNPITFSFGNTLKGAPGSTQKISMLVYNTNSDNITSDSTPRFYCKVSNNKEEIESSALGMNVGVGDVSKPYHVILTLKTKSDNKNLKSGIYACVAEIAGISNQFNIEIK